MLIYLKEYCIEPHTVLVKESNKDFCCTIVANASILRRRSVPPIDYSLSAAV